MNEDVIQRMLERAAEALKAHGDGENHTVASVIATPDGRLFHGLNLYHFTGGPCAEIVALSRAISDGEKHFAVIVALGDNGRGILPPCGQCRQILFDFCPDIHVVLDSESHIVRPIKDLLPETYNWHEQTTD